ncbi:MAG: serine/threonine phosphatase [Cyanobacteria bacterium P01_C01_bin.73]
MLVCSHCDFDNPLKNRFCQNCGHPLKRLTALVVRQAGDTLKSDREVASPQAASLQAASPWDAAELAEGDFLDRDRRYQLQEPLLLPTARGQSSTALVLDVLPGDPSPLEDKQANIQESLLQANDAGETTSPQLALLAQIPKMAHPYLALQEQLFSVLPELHSAWQQESYTVLILEDRSDLTLLEDCWSDRSLEPIQQIHWLFEISDLWHTLIPWQAQASLLEPDNLCVDEAQILCLKRLYFQAPDEVCELADLGQCWSALLERWPHSLPSLKPIVQAVTLGKVDQLKTLQNQLAQLADDLQQETDADFAVSLSDADGIETSAWSEISASSSQAVAPEPKLISEALDGHSIQSSNPAPLDPDAVAHKPVADGQGDKAALTQANSPADKATLEKLLGDESPEDESPEDESPEDESLEDENFEGANDTEALIREASDMASLLLRDALPEDDEGEGSDLAESTMVLPMVLMDLKEAGQTHVGQQRQHNEDTFYMRTELHKQDTPKGRRLSAKGLYILCDGMGGHESGEVASALAVESLQTYFDQHWDEELPAEDHLKAAIASANDTIYGINRQDDRSGSGRMGTTLVMVLLQNNQAAIAHVGDSRIYQYSRRQGMQQVTVDHEVGQREIQRGVEPAIAYARPDAYQLTQALGPRDSGDIRPSVDYIDLQEDTLFLLCSDGLSDNDLLETYCQSHVEPLLRSRSDLEDGVSALIDLANTHNGHDNITAILIRAKVRPDLDHLRH